MSRWRPLSWWWCTHQCDGNHGDLVNDHAHQCDSDAGDLLVDDAHINVMVMMAILFVEVAFSSFRCHRSLRSGGSPPHPRESCRSPPWRWGGGWRRSFDDGDGDDDDDGDYYLYTKAFWLDHTVMDLPKTEYHCYYLSLNAHIIFFTYYYYYHY